MSEEDDYREHERECAREAEHWLDEQIEAAVEAERERCLEIVERVCAKAAETQGDRADEALLVSSRERHIYGRRLVILLAEEIATQIRGQNG